MKQYTAALALWVLSAVGPALAEPPEGHVEPAYQGQPLSHWVEVLGGSEGPLDLLSSKGATQTKDLRGGAEAQTALEHIGTNAIPFLVRWIEGDLLITTSEHGTLELLSPVNLKRADAAWAEVFRAPGAVRAFGVLGPAARSAIPELLRLATNQLGAWANPSAVGRRAVEPPRSSWLALQALGAIGPDSAPVLLAIATNKACASGGRIGALLALGTNVPAAALSALLQCAKESDEGVAQRAVWSLRAFGQDDPRIFATLTNVAHHSAKSVRSAALEALRPFGAKSLPAFLYALTDRSLGVRYSGLRALIEVAPQALTNTSVLATAAQSLQSGDSGARFWGAKVLRAAGQQARGERPDLEGPVPDSEALYLDATNVLRRFAPDLLSRRPGALPKASEPTTN